MPEELYRPISEFVDRWDDSTDETPTALSLEIDSLDSEHCFSLLDGMEQLAGHFDTGAVTFWIDGGEDRYRVRYNPSSGSIQSERTRGTEYDIDQLHPDDDDVVSSLQQLDQNTATSGDQIREIFSEIHQADHLQMEAQCTLQKSAIENAILEEIDATDTTVHFYFNWENVAGQIRNTPPAAIREKLLEEDHSRSLIVVLSLEDYVYGDAVGITGLSVFSSIDMFSDRPAEWLDDMEEIRRQALIQEPDSLFLPPSFFRFQESSDEELENNTRELFARYTAFFSLLSIVNTAEYRDESAWHVRLQGRQFIEGDIEESSTDHFIVRFDDEEEEVELTNELIEDLYSLFSWTYSDDIENRITVVRNVATLYAHDLYEVITDASKIRGSAESNRRYYVRESVDEFFEFRQELTQSAFRTRREFATLRSELMNDLSRDIFRTFGFIIAIAASAVFRLNNILPPVPMYIAVAGLIFGYGFVTLRRVRGIRAQFVDLLENQSDYVDFYNNFFDDEELEELGLKPDETSPWWCGLYQWWWNRTGRVTDPIGIRCAFALDLWIYYVLILGVWILSAGMVAEATGYIDLVAQIP